MIAADALAFEWTTLAGAAAKVVANLPTISRRPFSCRLAYGAWPPWYSSLTLMFQKEVAERIAAPPDTKLSAGWRSSRNGAAGCASSSMSTARAFTPPPNVTSSLIQLIPRDQPEPDCDVADLERVTAAAFGQRRKMLRRASSKSFAEPAAGLLRRLGHRSGQTRRAACGRRLLPYSSRGRSDGSPMIRQSLIGYGRALVQDDGVPAASRRAASSCCGCMAAAFATATSTCRTAISISARESGSTSRSGRKLPFTMGHEISGYVEAAGPDVARAQYANPLCRLSLDRLRRMLPLRGRRRTSV